MTKYYKEVSSLSCFVFQITSGVQKTLYKSQDHKTWDLILILKIKFKIGTKSTPLSTLWIIIRNESKTTCLLLHKQEYFEDTSSKGRETKREKALWGGGSTSIHVKNKHFNLTPHKSTRQPGVKSGWSHLVVSLRFISSFGTQNTL